MKKFKIVSFGPNIDTDIIISGQYLRTTTMTDWKDHVFEAEDPDIAAKLGPDYIIFGGTNFGCGSSREQAAWAIKMSGVECVIAKSFGRIFFRNSINIGLKVYIAPDHTIEPGTKLKEVTLDEANNKVIAGKEEFKFDEYPPLMNELIRVGGLINYFNLKHPAAKGKTKVTVKNVTKKTRVQQKI